MKGSNSPSPRLQKKSDLKVDQNVFFNMVQKVLISILIKLYNQNWKLVRSKTTTHHQNVCR